MKRGSKYAYVNGKKKKLPTPARRVYSYKQKKNYIYVPGEFCAKHLGYSYSWSSSSYAGTSQQVTVIRHLLPLQRFQQQMENIMYNLINQRLIRERHLNN